MFQRFFTVNKKQFFYVRASASLLVKDTLAAQKEQQVVVPIIYYRSSLVNDSRSVSCHLWPLPKWKFIGGESENFFIIKKEKSTPLNLSFN